MWAVKDLLLSIRNRFYEYGLQLVEFRAGRDLEGVCL
jgi:hypothetical protein